MISNTHTHRHIQTNKQTNKKSIKQICTKATVAIESYSSKIDYKTFNQNFFFPYFVTIFNMIHY